MADGKDTGEEGGAAAHTSEAELVEVVDSKPVELQAVDQTEQEAFVPIEMLVKRRMCLIQRRKKPDVCSQMIRVDSS